MQLLRTMNTASAGDNDEALLDNWPKNQAAQAIDLDLDMPVTVAKVGGYTFTAADLGALLAYFLGVFSLSYGDKRQHKPYIGVDGNKLRRIERIMMQAEVWNDFVGVLKPAAAFVGHARLRITLNRKLAKGLRRFIGWTQGRTIQLETREGTVFPVQGAALLSRTVGVNFVCRVIPVYQAAGDQFNHLPHYREVNRAAQDGSLPDGKPIAVWDDNAAADATAIGKFTFRVGEKELHRLLEPNYVTRAYRQAIDAGGSDFTDEVTPLYVAPLFEDERKLPTGIPNMAMVTQDVASLMLRGLYFPVIDDAAATSIAAEAALARNETVVATIHNPSASPADNGHTATAGLEFIGAGDPAQPTVSGLVADKQGNVNVHVPSYIQAMAKSAGNAIAAAKVEKVTALAIPGSTATSGASLSNVVRANIRGVFAAFRPPAVK